MKQGRKAKNLVGKTLGKLTIVERVGTWISPKSAMWSCRCVCGAFVILATHHFADRRAPSCEACAPRVGWTKDSAYSCWRAMIGRCEEPSTTGYRLYGGRGIRVCARWRRSFLDFLADVGPRPSADHSLGRIDHDGHYEPGNVRWETKAQQLASRRPRNMARTMPVRQSGAA